MRPCILVVDDDELCRRTVRRLVQVVGCDVHEAATGNEAISHLHTTRYAAVVTDLTLPDLDGMELLRHVRSHHGDLPVLILTGCPSLATAQLAVDLDATTYACKPIDPTSFVRRLNDVLESSQAAQHDLLDRALEQMFMNYQPIVDRRQRAIAYEALMRTDAPIGGPLEILGIAHTLRRLQDVGRRVRECVADDLQSHLAPPQLFVNLHPDDLLDARLYDRNAPLTRHARRIVLELTERSPLHKVSCLDARISALRDLGFRIAIDDLGEGYASLTMIAKLRPDVVKIDRQLCLGIAKDPVREQLVRGVVAGFGPMGTHVVAEGIETLPDARVLEQAGCTLFQGYLFARPGPPFPEVLALAS